MGRTEGHRLAVDDEMQNGLWNRIQRAVHDSCCHFNTKNNQNMDNGTIHLHELDAHKVYHRSTSRQQ